MATRICRSCLVAIVGLCSLTSSASAQEGVGERLGARIDQGISELGDEFRESWASLQRTVDNLGVQGRVYSRLRWEKQLTDARIEVDVAEGGVVSLRGTVGNSTAKEKATRLAQDTVGVEKVVNHLTLLPTADLER